MLSSTGACGLERNGRYKEPRHPIPLAARSLFGVISGNGSAVKDAVRYNFNEPLKQEVSMRAITRRQFLEMAIGIPCLYSTPVLAAPAGGSRFQGCFLTSGSDDFLDKLKFSYSSDDKEVDQVCSAAERELRREFKVAPDTWFYDDVGGPNAFATWFLRRNRTVLSQWDSKADGTVCLGTRLVRRVTRRDELNRRWKTRLTAIMAHEWAHIVQFSKGHRNAGKSVELHADFLAGWFLGRTSVARDCVYGQATRRSHVSASSFWEITRPMTRSPWHADGTRDRDRPGLRPRVQS